MLEQEFKYYIDHQEELVSKYEGKFVVIKNQQVIGAYDSELEAYQKAQEKNQIGTFLIQRVSPGKEDYTQTFHSRVRTIDG